MRYYHLETAGEIWEYWYQYLPGCISTSCVPSGWITCWTSRCCLCFYVCCTLFHINQFRPHPTWRRTISALPPSYLNQTSIFALQTTKNKQKVGALVTYHPRCHLQQGIMDHVRRRYCLKRLVPKNRLFQLYGGVSRTYRVACFCVA